MRNGGHVIIYASLSSQVGQIALRSSILIKDADKFDMLHVKCLLKRNYWSIAMSELVCRSAVHCDLRSA